MYEEHIADAAFRGDLEFVKELILLGASRDEVNDKGNSPLHLAIENLCIDVIEFLLNAGADPNAEDVSGWTPLYRAVNIESDAASQANEPFPSSEILELLLAHGADPNLSVSSPGIPSRSSTPLQLARRYENKRAELLLKTSEARG